MEYITRTLDNLVHQTAFLNLTWGNYLVICVALVFMYLAIAKDFEPLLLVPISFGPADRQSIQLSDGSCCPVRNLFRIFRCDRARI